MSKKSRHRVTNRKPNAADSQSDLLADLRGIFRRLDKLRKPFYPTRVASDSIDDEFEYRIQCPSSHEQVLEEVLVLAGMTWHLKDKVQRWMSAREIKCEPSIEDVANGNMPLKICADLFDSKKHGGASSRSGHFPKLAGLSFGPLGRIGLRFDGSIVVGEYRTSSPDPVPYTVDIHNGDGTGNFGNALDVVSKGLDQWRIVLESLEFFSDENLPVVAVREMFERLSRSDYPTVRSNLIHT